MATVSTRWPAMSGNGRAARSGRTTYRPWPPMVALRAIPRAQPAHRTLPNLKSAKRRIAVGRFYAPTNIAHGTSSAPGAKEMSARERTTWGFGAYSDVQVHARGACHSFAGF